ncbi:GtrA family protein [Accumulibacter sp.]|uniref:GtrA family protein n=2 Tax=Betaproteobacteria incertae sedis TaxID=119066 RepID=UPI00338E3530
MPALIPKSSAQMTIPFRAWFGDRVDALLQVCCMAGMIRQLGWFVFVGCAAAATHWLIAVACVAVWHLPPLAANVCGWLVAFLVSFSGHYLLTFRQQRQSLAVACRRFFLVSAAGFLINEVSYACLLSLTDIPYDLLLGGILVAIAVLTFVFSRFWAFRSRAEAC